jgi:hypothetical protein
VETLYRFPLKAKIGKFELVATDRPPSDAPASVAARKFRIGYTARPVRQRVVFHPWLEPVFLRIGYPLVRYLRQRKPENPKLAKAEGLFRFALEGKRPLTDQLGPEALADQKAALLSSR